MDGHRLVRDGFRIPKGRVQGHDHPVGLGAFAQKDDGLDDGQPGFRQADQLQGLGRRHRLDHGLGIGQADVLGGMGDEPPTDDPGVHAPVDQPGKPGDGCVAVPAPQAFAEGGEHIVILLLVALHHLFLDALPGDLHRNVDDPIHRFGGAHRQLDGVEGCPGVPIGDAGDMVQGLRVHLGMVVPQAPLPVR